MAKPTFIGIGAQKCASSWLRDVLDDHPDVYANTRREVDFFSSSFNRGYRWYEDQFDLTGNPLAIGEISPSYFCDPLVPARIRDYAPDAKLILALRDPIARAFSNHLHEVRKGHVGDLDPTFETGLANNPMYLFQSRYGTHLRAWLEVFPRAQLLVVVQEEIALDPVAQAARLYQFVGVDPHHRSAKLLQRSHESVGARVDWLYNSWRAVGDAGRRYGLSDTVDRIKGWPPVAKIMSANRRDLRAQIPTMRPETESRLRELLAPELRLLAELLERQDWPWPTWRAAAADESAQAVSV